MNLKNIGEHPKTIDEAVDRLLVILTDDEKAEIKTMAKDDLVFMHFDLGVQIRNAFGLNDNNVALLGDRCADDVSMEIIEALWALL